jgi:3-methyladenine DNA glycosylase AlkD
MHEIVTAALDELNKISATPTGNHLKTGDIRKLSAKVFTRAKNKPADEIFAVCEQLLEEHSWALGVIAFDFAYRQRKNYDETTFPVFENWLVKYVRGWGDCDDFCTHAFGELICQNTALSEKVARWTSREEFWMRRAAAVVLIPSIWHDKYSETNPLRSSDLLMTDEHDLVRKGYGWMLKILSVKEPEMVFEYLKKNREIMPRVAFRYALEKMDSEKKNILMGKY